MMTVRVPTVPINSLWVNPSSECGNVQGNGGDMSVRAHSAVGRRPPPPTPIEGARPRRFGPPLRVGDRAVGTNSRKGVAKDRANSAGDGDNALTGANELPSPVHAGDEAEKKRRGVAGPVGFAADADRHDRPHIDDRIIINGAKYRIRDITATGLFKLSKPFKSLTHYSIAWPRGLRYDPRVRAWRAPDGLNVKRI